MLNRTLRGAVPLIVPFRASGTDLKTGSGAWLVPGEGLVPGCTLTAVEQRALWVAVETMNAAMKSPAVVYVWGAPGSVPVAPSP
jgi:hypothetical protein